jgi:c-di-GMP phosphodiesterase
MAPQEPIHPVFVGRQPVFNDRDQIVGFQICFRRDASTDSPMLAANAATVELLRTSLVDIGIEHLVGDRLAFLVLPRLFLDSDVLTALPAEQTVLEIPRDWLVDDALLKAAMVLKASGFRIAFDETHVARDPISAGAVANIVRIDVHKRDSAGLSSLLRRLGLLGLETLADGIDTYAVHAVCRSLGFHYYQGSFLSYPNLVKGHRIGGSEMVLLRLLDCLQWPDTTDAEIERLVTSDTALSVAMLKLVNSPRFRRSQTIESVRHALMLLGRKLIGQWSLLLALGSVSGSPQAIETALIRARLGYLIAINCGRQDADRFFTLGLLSAIDRLFGVPLSEILKHIQLGPEMSAALLRGEGFMALVLEVVESFERPECPVPEDLGRSPEELSRLYLDAIRWTRDILSELVRG